MNTRANREAIKEALIQLEQKGRLTPTDVIEEAKDPKSPLHGEFVWDMEQAAQRDWMSTARALIRSYVIEVKTTTIRTTLEAPFYVRDPNLPHKTEGYIRVSELSRRPDGPAELYRQELGRVIAMIDRLEALSISGSFSEEFSELASAVKKFRTTWARLKADGEAAA